MTTSGSGAKADYDDRIQCFVCKKWYQRITLSHLYQHGMNTTEYRERYSVDYMTSKALRFQMSQQSRKAENRYRYVPFDRTEILEAIRGYAQIQKPLTSRWLLQKDPGLCHQFQKLFNEWAAGLRAAGVSERDILKSNQWDEDKIVTTAHEWVNKYGPLNSRDLLSTNSSLHSKLNKTFGGIEAAAKILGISYQGKNEIWNRERIVKEIRGLKKKMQKLQPTIIKIKFSKLYIAGIEHFGTWSNALVASGIDPMDHYAVQNWSDGELEKKLRAWALSRGGLSYVALKAENHALLRATQRKYGSPKKAGEKLGLTYLAGRRILSKEDVICGILARAKRGDSMLSLRVKEEDSALLYGVKKHFGNWGNAMRYANVKYDPREGNRIWTHDRAKSELEELVRRFGPLTSSRVRKENSALYSALQKKYSGVEKAAKLFRLAYAPMRNSHSRGALLKRIRKRSKDGLVLQAKLVQIEDSSFFGSVVRYFANWNLALAEAGLDPNKFRARKDWDRDKIHNALKIVIKEEGELTWRAISSQSGLVSVVKKRYGSIKKVIREFGLPVIDLDR